MSLIRFSAALLLTILYSLLFYLQYTNKVLVDFSSLYFATDALYTGINPYQVLTTHILPVQKIIIANLNPPCLLWLFQILLPFGYNNAFIIWTILSSFAGIKVAAIVYKILKEKVQFSINKCDYYVLFFSLYPIFMNSVLSQMGFVLAFFILQGYQYTNENKPLRAGVLWGTIAAFKLFPLLLLIYAFLNKQWRLIAALISTLICVTLIPLLFHNSIIYDNYYSIIHRALWYGDSWNASFYGFLFRLFADPVHSSLGDLLYIKLAYSIFFILGLCFYWKKATCFINKNNTLGAFNLTLVMMLFLSPLGWLYYFSILILPALTAWSKIQSGVGKFKSVYFIITYASLALLCCPIIYTRVADMPSFITQITLFSCHFYGLLLLIAAVYFPPQMGKPSYGEKDVVLLNRLLVVLISWGVLVLAYYIIYTFLTH